MSKISISKETLAVLKNFAGFNSNVLVPEGNVIKTITPAKNVMAIATVQEEFPVEFGIWDLNKFIGTVSLFDNPTFEFFDNHMKIHGGSGSSIKYMYSAKRLLTIPERDINMPDHVVEFDLHEDSLLELKKAGAVLQLEDLSISSDDGVVVGKVFDKSDPTSNNYSIELGDLSGGKKFDFHFKLENL